MSGILTALRLGELMTATELTWQAAPLFAVIIAAGVAVVALLAAKAVKAWRDALK